MSDNHTNAEDGSFCYRRPFDVERLQSDKRRTAKMVRFIDHAHGLGPATPVYKAPEYQVPRRTPGRLMQAPTKTVGATEDNCTTCVTDDAVMGIPYTAKSKTSHGSPASEEVPADAIRYTSVETTAGANGNDSAEDEGQERSPQTLARKDPEQPLCSMQVGEGGQRARDAPPLPGRRRRRATRRPWNAQLAIARRSGIASRCSSRSRRIRGLRP